MKKSLIALLIVIIAVGIVGGSIYYYQTKKQAKTPIQNQQVNQVPGENVDTADNEVRADVPVQENGSPANVLTIHQGAVRNFLIDSFASLENIKADQYDLYLASENNGSLLNWGGYGADHFYSVPLTKDSQIRSAGYNVYGVETYNRYLIDIATDKSGLGTFKESFMAVKKDDQSKAYFDIYIKVIPDPDPGVSVTTISPVSGCNDIVFVVSAKSINIRDIAGLSYSLIYVQSVDEPGMYHDKLTGTFLDQRAFDREIDDANNRMIFRPKQEYEYPKEYFFKLNTTQKYSEGDYANKTFTGTFYNIDGVNCGSENPD